jgi:hypothetical protein
LSRISGSFVIGRYTAQWQAASGERAACRRRSGRHLWAERLDKSVADLFDIQDEIVSRLTNTLNIQLIEAEAQRARSPHPDAMNLYFRWPPFVDPENVDSMIWMAAVDVALGSSFLTDDKPQRWKEEVKTRSASRGQTVLPGQIQPGLQHRPGPGVRCS